MKMDIFMLATEAQAYDIIDLFFSQKMEATYVIVTCMGVCCNP